MEPVKGHVREIFYVVRTRCELDLLSRAHDLLSRSHDLPNVIGHVISYL